MKTMLPRWFFLPMGLAMAALITINFVGADDPAKKAPPGAKAKPASPDKTDVAANEALSPEALLDRLRTLSQERPEGETQEAFMANYAKVQRAISETATKLLTASDGAKEDGLSYAAAAVQTKIQALMTLEKFGDDKARGELNVFVKSLATHPRPEIQEIAASLALQLKFSLTPDAEEAEAQAMVAELKKEFGEGEIKPQMIGMIMEVTRSIERLGFNDVAADANTFFSKRFAENKDPRIVEISKQMAGTVRRLNLPGNPIDVTGTYLDGKEIDWASYQGKVVLIDYWATWCGPCIQELPNVLENYEKYHAKGFDVLGISLDTDHEAVEAFVEQRKLPWRTLFSADPEANGWKDPMVTRYGISGIPAVILVDQKGNVVSLDARGPALGEALAKLLGPVEDSGTAGESPAPETGASTDR